MKKRLFIVLVVVLLLAMALPIATVGASPGSIVGLWHLDEGTGTNASDSSGNNNGGTIYGATWAGSGNGMFGDALSFDGTDDYVEVADSSSLDLTGSITVEGWINLTSFSQPATVAAKWKDTGGTNGRGYLLTVATDGTPRFYISTDGSNYPRATGSALSLNTWYHLAGTYDGTSIKLYVNGTLVATTPQAGAMFLNSEPLLIGANDGYGGTARKFTNGVIDEVRIWDRALTITEIADNYGRLWVGIDIKPGSDPNAINLGSKGVIPVAVLSTASFDAATVDPFTVELGGLGVRVKGKSGNAGSLKDVNGDGLLDLVVQVETENLDPNQFQDGEVCLTGTTYGGVAIKGCDEIVIVPA